MRYNSIQELPETIQAALPEEAQKVYIDAYNDMWDRYEDMPHDGNLSRDGFSHQTAWTTVTDQFVQVEGSGEWYRKGEEPSEQEMHEQNRGLLGRLKDMVTGS